MGDIGEGIIQPLKGKQLNPESLAAALPDRLDDIILNLKKEDFIRLIY